jgi:cytochrome c556
LDRAAELREQATRVAQQAAARDLERCQLALLELAGTCTRCHQSFRVPVQIRAFAGND